MATVHDALIRRVGSRALLGSSDDSTLAPSAVLKAVQALYTVKRKEGAWVTAVRRQRGSAS